MKTLSDLKAEVELRKADEQRRLSIVDTMNDGVDEIFKD